MKKIIIIYGTTTGNTEEMANKIAEIATVKGNEVELKNAKDANPADLINYDLIFLGSSTWGNGELQDDFLNLEDGLRDLNLEGKKVAVFGNGMSVYPSFCGAVNAIEQIVKDIKGEIVTESLKIDWGEGEEMDKTEEWANKILT